MEKSDEDNEIGTEEFGTVNAVINQLGLRTIRNLC